MTATRTPNYVCRYCRLPTTPQDSATGLNCVNCGGALDIRTVRSDSGWQRQPPIHDMARIQFGRSHLQIVGDQVPVADFRLADGESIYFPHHALLWGDPSVRMANHPSPGGWKRMMAGMPAYLFNAFGPGRIGLSDNHAGEIIALPLMPGWGMWVREHRFLVAGGNVDFTYEPTNIWYYTGSGNDRETERPLGAYADVFFARNEPGLLLLHAPGNAFFRDLGAGETLLIQPSALLYKDMSVTMQLHVEYPAASGISWRRSYSHRHTWLRLSGPGRVAAHSTFERPESSDRITGGPIGSSQRW